MKRIYTGDLIKFVSRQHGMKATDARRLVLGLLEYVQSALDQGKDVQLEHLGTLHVTERKVRAENFGRPNPHAGLIQRGVTLRDSKGLRRRLNSWRFRQRCS